MGQSLYNLTAEFKAVERQMEEAGMPEEVINDTLESISLPFEEKALSIVAMIKNADALADAIKQEEKKMKERREIVENRAKSLRTYLLNNMRSCNKNRIENAQHTASIRKNPKSVHITDDRLIPEPFLRVVPATKEPDKTRIKEAILNGTPVPGCSLVEGVGLTIK